MAKRASTSSSSGQPGQPKRPYLDPTGQVRNGSEGNLVLGSCSTEEEDGQRVKEDNKDTCDVKLECDECVTDFSCNVILGYCSLLDSAEKSWNVQISLGRILSKKEAVELAIIHSPHFGRANAISTAKNDVRNLQLQFQTKVSLSVFTGKKLEGKGAARISVALINANTRDVITSGPESSIKLNVVVLEGDFNKDDEDNWAQEEFEKYVVKAREGKGPLLTGNLLLTLKGGVGELGELIFTDNSSWTRSKRFRIGLKVALRYCENTRIREAKTNAFRVKEQRGESFEKHHPPASDDEVWRLEMIAKDGKYHQKLSEVGVDKVEDFLLQLFTDSKKLREILGKSLKSKNWEILVRHAKTCKRNFKLYLYYSDGMRKHGAVFNIDGQLIGVIRDRVYFAAHRLSAQEKEHGDTIVKMALDNWNDVRDFNSETFSGSLQKKSSSSFPSQIFEGQIEYLTPVQRNLAPRICAAPVGPEAPLINAGFTAEGNNGITAAGLPIQSQSLNSQNATLNPMEPSADTDVQPFGQPSEPPSSFLTSNSEDDWIGRLIWDD